MTSTGGKHMIARTTVVTGAGSGVGRETVALLRAQGQQVVGVDLREADVVADLSTDEGRRSMVRDVETSAGGAIDAIIACAGVLTEDANAVSVNFFGAVRTIEGLRPFLERSTTPRVVAVSSVTALSGWLDELVDACLDLDEERARQIATNHASEYKPGQSRIYSSTKRALSLWVRRSAVSPLWCGHGVLVNAVAPCGINTPMSQKHFTDDALRMMEAMSPLRRPHAEPGEIAQLLCFLASPANSLIVGQTVFVDAGFEATKRPEHV
jgi:NAD(P)-dependent dehydrogenase (short-subunit alcohol dehydrogenase family)